MFDILLLGMDGWEFLVWIKELLEMENLLVVIILIVVDINCGLLFGVFVIL